MFLVRVQPLSLADLPASLLMFGFMFSSIFQFFGVSSQGPPSSFMPAIGITVTDANDGPLSPPIEIDLPNRNGNLTNNKTHSCGNLSGLLTVNYQLEIESPDTAWVVEIYEG